MKLFVQLFYIPHLIIYLLLNEGTRSTIKKDIEAFNKRNNSNKAIGYSLLAYLSRDRYYRKMFYSRIGKYKKLLSWYAPGDKYFFPIRNIGGGVYLAHPYATVLNAKSIGENFSCRQCTTIGNKADGRNDLRPTIGNNVQVGANVTIIGDITIGDNVIIGAGSVVIKSIESNSIVVGNPAAKIRNNDKIYSKGKGHNL